MVSIVADAKLFPSMHALAGRSGVGEPLSNQFDVVHKTPTLSTIVMNMVGRIRHLLQSPVEAKDPPFQRLHLSV
jgi:hypothetical protein